MIIIYVILQVEQIMGKFEKQFEDIDVRTSVSFENIFEVHSNGSFFFIDLTQHIKDIGFC